MSAKVVRLPVARPRTFTTAEAMLDRVRERIFACGMTYTMIAAKAGVGTSTIQNIATGKTRWPRSTTLFPLLETLGLHIQLIER